MSLKYNYRKCAKCGIDKPNNNRSCCNPCIHKREKARRLAIEMDTGNLKCQKCGRNKNLTDNPLCTKCTARKKRIPVYANCLVCGIEKKPNTTSKCATCTKEYIKKYAERRQEVERNKKKYVKEVIEFVRTIVARNYYCCMEEIFMIINYHILLFDKYYSEAIPGFEQVRLMWKDLVKFSDKQRTAFSK